MMKSRAYAMGKLAGYIALVKQSMPQSPMATMPVGGPPKTGYNANPGGTPGAGNASWLRSMMAKKPAMKRPMTAGPVAQPTPQPAAGTPAMPNSTMR